MVDKLFNKMFNAMDNSQAIQQVTNIFGTSNDQHITLGQHNLRKPDKTLCIIHKLKKTFFCEDCCFELCVKCKEQHEAGHVIKFIEESAKFVMDRFRDSLEDLKSLRFKVSDAANQDPSEFPPEEGQVNILELGDKEIDNIFVKLEQQLNQAKQEMKQRLREAYKANYRATIDKKSANYLTQLDKLEGYVNACLDDFQKKQQKNKLVVICAQRPKIEELYQNINKFETAFQKMCEKSRESRNEFQIHFKSSEFENNFKELLNMHISASYPGLESGFFQGIKKSISLSKSHSDKTNKSVELELQKTSKGSADFDPLKSLEEEEYDIRRAKEYPKKQQLIIEEKQHIVDTRFQLRTLKFRRDKFEVKIYDTQNKKSRLVEVPIPVDCRRIATRYFSYVNTGRELIMSGGQFIDDKTCSLDCFKIHPDDGILEDIKAYMKVARMHHSMIFIDERNVALAVGGEDENGNLIDSCEIYDNSTNHWKVLNTLNYKSKSIGLCKFSKSSRRPGDLGLYVYAFGKQAIERIDLCKSPIDSKWEELRVKHFQPLNMCSISLQFDDNLILICGGTDEKNPSLQDITYFNPSVLAMQKSTDSQLSVCDKFVGGAMTQYIINRMECKIFLCSEAFVHEIEYGAKAGDSKFKSKANLY